VSNGGSTAGSAAAEYYAQAEGEGHIARPRAVRAVVARQQHNQHQR